jgi:uncharacterized short protein YbdD (DUF466 family)
MISQPKHAREADRPGASATAELAQGAGGLRLRMHGLCSACRQAFGMPDYERYLAHAAQRHPGAAVLTRGEFCARELERRYGRGGARCC